MPHGLVTFPRRLLPWIEPWFLVYACLGVVQGGMLPLLLPLSAGGSTHAGVIVGVMNLAGLTAPFWGHLADRRRLHRQVLLAGMLAALVALLFMPTQLGLPLKTVFAAVLGVGFAAANTVANMFIVEVRPPDEWDARIGALQALSGLGQVMGLLLAGLIGGRYALAYGVAAALVAASVPMAWLTLRGIQVPVRRDVAAAHPPVGGEGWAGSPQRMFHIPTWRGLWALLQRTRNAVRAPDDRVVRGVHRDQRGPHDVAAGAHSGIWRVDGVARHDLRLRRRRQPGDVSAGGEDIKTARRPARAAGRFRLARHCHRGPGSRFLIGIGGVPLALAGFVVLVVAWPLLGVSGTALAAQLAPGEKGEALGLFNASSSLAGAIGAFLGGWAMEVVGYGAVCMVGAVVVGLAALCSGGQRHVRACDLE